MSSCSKSKIENCYECYYSIHYTSYEESICIGHISYDSIAKYYPSGKPVKIQDRDMKIVPNTKYICTKD